MRFRQSYKDSKHPNADFRKLAESLRTLPKVSVGVGVGVGVGKGVGVESGGVVWCATRLSMAMCAVVRLLYELGSNPRTAKNEHP